MLIKTIEIVLVQIKAQCECVIERHGDALQARDLLESERPQFAAALEAAAQESNAARCIDLLNQLRSLTGRDSGRTDDDVGEEREVFAAAEFGTALECYRLDPTVPQVALSLVVALDELGMAESTPAVLLDAVRAHPEPAVVGESLGLSLAAMASEEDAGDPGASASLRTRTSGCARTASPSTAGVASAIPSSSSATPSVSATSGTVGSSR